MELETPPFMEKTILNFHFDYLTPSLIYKIARDKSGVLVLLFIIQSVQSQVQVNLQYFFRQVVGEQNWGNTKTLLKLLADLDSVFIGCKRIILRQNVLEYHH